MSTLSLKRTFKLPLLKRQSIIGKLPSFLRQKEGAFTKELALGLSPLGKLPQRLKPDQTTTMTCGFCSTGCSLTVHLKEKKVVNLSPTPHYPVNLGKACPKGWEALTPLQSKNRATMPLLKNSEGNFEEVSWHEALQSFATNFKSVQKKYGSESVAFLSTGQIANEEMALLGALTKFGMGMLHGDGNTRQCMATSVAAYKQSFGFDAPPYTYKDLEESDVLVFVGANPCIAHPILWERVCLNQHQPKIIVIDPRKTETAMLATHHYAAKPDSDLTLFYGIASILIQNDWIDHEMIESHTTQFEDFKTFVQKYTPERVSQATNLSVEQIQELAELIHEGKRVSFWWTMGVNQSHQGTRTAQSLINLALMTGNIGRPGTGANSITGQCNAMGSRLFSNTTNLLGGHDFLNPKHRQKVASLLKIDPSRIPDKNSLAYDQIIEGINQGKIKGLWIIATNPAHSWINQNSFHELRKKLDFLVVQDMYHNTESAQIADLVLPSAGWGEKEGTFINSERRIGLIKNVAQAPGQALADFHIFKLIAEYWGCRDLFQEWDSPQSVFQILKKLTKNQPCDITGITDYEMINQQGGIQWPLPKGESVFSQERRLFENREFYHPDKKARFLFDESQIHPEPIDEAYPFILLTGRGTSAQWHTQTRTCQSEILKKLYPQTIYIEINPEDAQQLGITDNDWICIQSRRGKIKAQASIQATIPPQHVFIPMHYHETNQLTFPAFDPHSRQPAYKTCAVQLSNSTS